MSWSERAWQKWLAVAQVIGRFQTALLVGILYFVVVPVFSLVRLADPLRLRLYKVKRQAKTYWQPRDPRPLELRDLRRQG